MPSTWARAARAVLAAGLLVAAAGCAGPVPGPAPDRTPAPTPTPAVVVPAEGVSLAALGLRNGPTGRVFLPQDTLLTSRVDSAANVTLVLGSPGPGVLAAYLRTTLPANGFTLTADDPAATTLTFAGFGWSGTFTGRGGASALLLRPAA